MTTRASAFTRARRFGERRRERTRANARASHGVGRRKTTAMATPGPVKPWARARELGATARADTALANANDAKPWERARERIDGERRGAFCSFVSGECAVVIRDGDGESDDDGMMDDLDVSMRSSARQSRRTTLNATTDE